jgi:hypothetical protein
MAVGQLSTIVRQLRSLLTKRDGEGVTDECLLEGFLRRWDEASFEALVWRHGPMVLGVCRRILGNSHDAEDAFQAMFLVRERGLREEGVRPALMAARGLLLPQTTAGGGADRMNAAPAVACIGDASAHMGKRLLAVGRPSPGGGRPGRSARIPLVGGCLHA